VRIGRLPDSALVARRVGEIKWVLCASPGYIRQRAEPRAPDDLSGHDCIALEGLQRYRDWSFVSEGANHQLSITPRFSINTAERVIGGAVAGLGVARAMPYQAAASVRAATLVPILSDAPPPFPVQLVHAAHQQQPLKLRAFLDFVASRLQEWLRLIAEELRSVELTLADCSSERRQIRP
jgi:DNA-binding transcriptional LysR family regulator